MFDRDIQRVNTHVKTFILLSHRGGRKLKRTRLISITRKRRRAWFVGWPTRSLILFSFVSNTEPSYVWLPDSRPTGSMLCPKSSILRGKSWSGSQRSMGFRIGVSTAGVLFREHLRCNDRPNRNYLDSHEAGPFRSCSKMKLTRGIIFWKSANDEITRNKVISRSYLV